jgi:hypothetical protein
MEEKVDRNEEVWCEVDIHQLNARSRTLSLRFRNKIPSVSCVRMCVCVCLSYRSSAVSAQCNKPNPRSLNSKATAGINASIYSVPPLSSSRRLIPMLDVSSPLAEPTTALRSRGR